jgi:heme A synthase
VGITSFVLDREVNAMRFQISGMFVLLLVEYLLGMFLNLFSGDPDPAKKSLSAHIALFTHIGIGLLLLLGAIFILLTARKNTVGVKTSAWALVGIILAIFGGIITVSSRDLVSELGSYLMAISFIEAFSLYAYLFFKSGIPASQ